MDDDHEPHHPPQNPTYHRRTSSLNPHRHAATESSSKTKRTSTKRARTTSSRLDESEAATGQRGGLRVQGFRGFDSEGSGSPVQSMHRKWFVDDGVRNWLIELGLGRYANIFEVHEVDDEVLPYLTLEDLKDMGINAVGSRMKLYSAILKLRKGYSDI